MTSSRVFLILCYNCTPSNSETFQSLLENYNPDLNLLSVVLWNNGPHLWGESELLETKQDKFPVRVIQTIDNYPLSWIYNQFINLYDADYYVIFDDDSTLNESYLKDVASYCGDGVAVPTIMVDGEIKHPKVNDDVKTHSFLGGDYVNAIGSGLLLSKFFIEKIKQCRSDVFDIDLAFYGVDSAFFLSLAKLSFSGNIQVISGFNHSLSVFEEESVNVKRFRQREKSILLGVMIRKYKHKEKKLLLKWVLMLGRLLNILVQKKHRFVDVWSGFYYGSHPKCRAMSYEKMQSLIKNS